MIVADEKPIARTSDTTDPQRRLDDDRLQRFRVVRLVVYGGIVLACLLWYMMADREPALRPRAPSPEAAAFRSPPAPWPEKTATAPDDDQGRPLEWQVQLEISVLAALREQVQEARKELAGLQEQTSAVRTAIEGMKRQQDAPRAGAAKLGSRSEPQRPSPQAEAARPPLAAASAQATPAPATPPAQATGDRVVTRQSVNVRAMPAKDAAIQRTAAEGLILRVYGRSRDGWVQVGDDAPWGWIYSNLLGPAP